MSRKFKSVIQADSGLIIPAGAGAGKILTSDTSGNATWASGATLVSSLPASPADAQEVYYLADATNGILWHLRYRAASASAYKWEYVGGPRLFNEVATSQTTASLAYADLAGPSVTTPLAGDYEIDFGVDAWNNTAGRYTIVTVKLGTAAAVDAEALVTSSHTAGQESSPARTIVRTSLAAASVLKLMYRVDAASTATIVRRWIAARAIRVG